MAKIPKDEVRRILEGKSNIDSKEEFRKGKQEMLAKAGMLPPDEYVTTTRLEIPVVPDTKTNNTTEPEPVAVGSTEPLANPEPATEPSAGGLSLEDRLELMERENQLRDLRAQRQAQEIDKWKYLAQTRAGELDFIKKRGQATEDFDDSDNDDTELFQEPSEPARPAKRTAMAADDEVLQVLRDTVKEKVIAEFHRDFPNFDINDKDFQEVLMACANDVKQELQDKSPKRYGKALTRLLRTAKVEAEYIKTQRALEEFKNQKLSREQKIRDQKLEMTSAKGANPKPAAPTITAENWKQELSLKEMGQLIRAAAKKNTKRRST